MGNVKDDPDLPQLLLLREDVGGICERSIWRLPHFKMYFKDSKGGIGNWLTALSWAMVNESLSEHEIHSHFRPPHDHLLLWQKGHLSQNCIKDLFGPTTASLTGDWVRAVRRNHRGTFALRTEVGPDEVPKG
jgi:hypothetical protein